MSTYSTGMPCFLQSGQSANFRLTESDQFNLLTTNSNQVLEFICKQTKPMTWVHLPPWLIRRTFDHGEKATELSKKEKQHLSILDPILTQKTNTNRTMAASHMAIGSHQRLCWLYPCPILSSSPEGSRVISLNNLLDARHMTNLTQTSGGTQGWPTQY